MMRTDWLSLLVCPICRSPKLKRRPPTRYHQQNPAVQEELCCPSCQAIYPVVNGVPILFSDPDRIVFTIDAAGKQASADKISQLNQQYMESDSIKRLELEEDKEKGRLAWEYFYWFRWAGPESQKVGFLEGDRERIDHYLADEEVGQGRLRFLETVDETEGGLSGKVLLNVGCGRDLLLEHMLDKGCFVIEQDIVLDSLLTAQRRGASFCLCSDLAELPIADNVIDALTSFSVLHHVWPILTPLKQIVRTLKAGGRAYFVEPNAFAFGTIGKSLIPRRLFKILERRQKESVSPSPFEKCINPFIMSQMLVKTGLRKADVRRFFWRDIKGNLPQVLQHSLRLLLLLLPVLSTQFLVVARKTPDASAV